MSRAFVVYPASVIPTPGGLPQSIHSALASAAREWFASRDRPRPTSTVVRYWDALIEKWVRDRRNPLLVRKNDGKRGCEQHHAASGRVVVCTDNSPAHWTLAMAISGERPRLADLRAALESGEWPICMALRRAEAQNRPKYRGVLNASRQGRILTREGWKVCHIQGLRSELRGGIDALPIEALMEQSRRFLSPSNMFVVPKTHSGFGELPEVLEYFGSRSRMGPARSA